MSSRLVDRTKRKKQMGGARGVKLLPGTCIETGTLGKDDSRKIFESIFAGGGLMLSQICNMTGLEPYTVQNWVKRKYVSNPKGRMYNVDQFSRLVIINMLKESLQLDMIEKLLSYINGHLDDTSDDTITDSELYHLFVNLLLRLEKHYDRGAAETVALDITESYSEPVPGARRRLCKVLVIMTQTYYSAKLRRESEMLMAELD